MLVPTDMFLEGLFYIQHRYAVAVCIPVKETVTSY